MRHLEGKDKARRLSETTVRVACGRKTGWMGREERRVGIKGGRGGDGWGGLVNKIPTEGSWEWGFESGVSGA